jgi:acyl-CoA synthetase (AMP-forming)/AMP-acid ligase II
VPVLTTYGATETCGQATTAPLGAPPSEHLGAGVPLPGVEIAVRDGEILVRGPTLFSGYVSSVRSGPAWDRSSWQPLGSDGWWGSGDLGHLDPEGRLHVVGRASDVIITGGENVHPTEVEAVLGACPGVREACAFGVEDLEYGEVIAVVLEVEGSCDENAWATRVREFCQTRMPSHRRPRWFGVLQKLPRNSTGKVQRNAVRARSVLRPVQYTGPEPTPVAAPNPR